MNATREVVAMVGQAWRGIITLAELRGRLTAEEWAMVATLDDRLNAMVELGYE